MKKFTIDTYAVMGNPIAHSKSPFIHAAFAKQTGQKLTYIPLLIPIDGFIQAVKNFQQQGGKGLNITIPFKLTAYQLVDHPTKRAQLAQAINIIGFEADGTLWGDNTDGIGLVRDIIQNQNFSLDNKRLLLLGAGGAVQGILEPLLAEKPHSIIIANRTVDKAIRLVQRFQHQGTVKACSFAELAGQQFDLIINGTGASLTDELPPLPNNILAPKAWCYDMCYGKETVFQRWALDHGASKAIEGIGMLVEQAAESFYLWRRVRPNTKPIIELLCHAGESRIQAKSSSKFD